MTVEEDRIQERQHKILFWSAGYVCLTLIIWCPVIRFTSPGDQIHPMVQLALTVFVILPLSFFQIVQACRQVYTTWPRRTGVVALVAALLPVLLFVGTQWYLLGNLQITYGD
ncbi:hypothetical protein [Gimesia panareensis]|uniref:Uncharacterized protein n=1 Tax=Gimesia panareensis TaxID=2527978 RepID=A0A517QCY3_9PLAN|nr:hypothetical protein [Gimesia panareensis]QDT29487.1 hypothetical protein Enr10x_48420 [Gimesia panareensis]QDU52532.1 hypothetical protein Pan110_49120 [Gimesia panareensis]